MAKKTIKVGLRSTGAEPAVGDVNISYKGSRIAGLSESSTAVLETENTIVTGDISVEYTQPSISYSNIEVKLENSANSSGSIAVSPLMYDAPLDMLASNGTATLSKGQTITENMLDQGGSICVGVNVAITGVTYNGADVPYTQAPATYNNTRPIKIVMPNNYDRAIAISIVR